jgi:hypothetical protein
MGLRVWEVSGEDRSLDLGNTRHRHTNATHEAQVQAQRAVGRSWPCTLGLVAEQINDAYRTNRMVSGYR